MNVALWQYLIVCPLVFLAGFVDAVAGGGGLISLPAYLISGLPAHFAIATNKMSSSMGTTIATVEYARKGFIPWRQAISCVACALVGSNIGANLALRIGDQAFKIVMLFVLPLTAAYTLRRKAFTPAVSHLSKAATIALCMAVSLLLGMYDGFYGPGTGTFLLLLLTGIAQMPLNQANGTAKAINLATNLSALTVFLINGKVLFPLGILAGCFSIAGNYLGARYFEHGGVKSVKPIMLAVLGVFFVKVLIELIG